ncbi:MAG: hypothetical protein J5691_01225 [Bacilli bacterium]|nr:hypothetical protein [Bacilli bacterium]
MYMIRENIIEGEVQGYWVDEKIHGIIVESTYVTLHPRSCSCHFFTESKNVHNHFHINLVEHWIKSGKPIAAIYGKSKKGKIVTLCQGFVKS